MDLVVKRFEIYFINLDPTLGSEIKKIRPCIVLSPEVVNKALHTVIVAPLTSTIRAYPTRVDCLVDGKTGQIALDQLRAVDKIRFNRKLGRLDPSTSTLVLATLQEMFSE